MNSLRIYTGMGLRTQDTDGLDALALELQPLVDKVSRQFETTGARGRTATLKVKVSDFELITRLQVSSRR